MMTTISNIKHFLDVGGHPMSEIYSLIIAMTVSGVRILNPDTISTPNSLAG